MNTKNEGRGKMNVRGSPAGVKVEPILLCGSKLLKSCRESELWAELLASNIIIMSCGVPNIVQLNS